MTHHAVSHRRQARLDWAELRDSARGEFRRDVLLIVDAGASVLVAVIGLKLLEAGLPAGIIVGMAGALCIGLSVSWWWVRGAEQDATSRGEKGRAGSIGRVPRRATGPHGRHVLELLAADGIQEDSGRAVRRKTRHVVCAQGSRRAVRDLLSAHAVFEAAQTSGAQAPALPADPGAGPA